MPELYHVYAGHDTNRDWFMLNLKETRLLTRLLYKEWFPTILYDVHQMGRAGRRLFVPPFHDPINPNLDPRISQGIVLIGAHMAYDLAAAGQARGPDATRCTTTGGTAGTGPPRSGTTSSAS